MASSSNTSGGGGSTGDPVGSSDGFDDMLGEIEGRLDIEGALEIDGVIEGT
jgi:hypothetical protein